jgi:serine/threonine protein kinase
MQAPAPTTEFDGGAIGNVVGSTSPFSYRGDWHALELCGRGGAAEIWHAVASDGRTGVLKRLRPPLRREAAARDLLRREFALLCDAAGSGFVRPLELIECDDGPVLALEYLPHGDLVSLLGAPARQWLPALRGVVAALTALHARGVAHGDVKARNVLFAADGGARLIDLTSARAAAAPAMPGTAAYSLPRGRRATAAAGDCFAVAVLVHELVTGRLPYGVQGPVEVADMASGPDRPADASAERLQTAARAMLEAGGGLPQGLSHFADVIESVSAEHS